MDESTKFNNYETYLNPVYQKPFPDPFVLKYRGEYFAYCTDFSRDGKVFSVLKSRDLVNWREIGGAMQKLDSDAPYYWAPEVFYFNGKFYLYYSVGNEILMELRVAVSERPDSGFIDSGKKLTTEDFAIDAHLFTDSDGSRYLFYATDFLTHSHIGTGTVVDTMIDFFTLKSNPRPVTRAKFDWQIYDPNRLNKGGVRWHTVEGPFVLKRKGIYYQMFSGGNWQNLTYGVSFAVTDDLQKTEEWEQFADGEKILPVLRTIPDLVVGPGHNSVIRGLNNRELFCIYHCWNHEGRVLAIDRMDYAGNRIFIKGATYSPQPAPFKPAFSDFFDGKEINKNWEKSEEWTIFRGELLNLIFEKNELIYQIGRNSFLIEFSFRLFEMKGENSIFGFALFAQENKIGEFLIYPYLTKAVFRQKESQWQFNLPTDFNFFVFHHLRIEVDFQNLKIQLDDFIVNFNVLLHQTVNNIKLFAEDTKLGFSDFVITNGFEELFEWQEDIDFVKYGWAKITENARLNLKDNQLFFSADDENEAIIIKGEAAENFEFAANIRLNQTFSEDFSFGFLLLDEDDNLVSKLNFEKNGELYFLSNQENQFALPAHFDPENYQQFRFIKVDEIISCESENAELGEINISINKIKIAFFCQNAEITLEMVRLTIL